MVTPTGVEGHFVVTAETLRAVGDMVAKAHGAGAGPGPPR